MVPGGCMHIVGTSRCRIGNGKHPVLAFLPVHKSPPRICHHRQLDNSFTPDLRSFDKFKYFNIFYSGEGDGI